MKFYRNTHDANGEPREFSVEAQDCWHGGAGAVGHTLSPTEGMSFDDIVEDEDRYHTANPETPMPTREQIAIWLVQLLEYDMARCE